jgi:hypothetical protein
MSTRAAGFEPWRISFDEHGTFTGAGNLVKEIAAANATDLFVFCHGWNNSERSARSLYERFFRELAGVLATHRPAAGRVVGTAGVFWPSLLWADEETPAATLPEATPAEEHRLVEDLRAIYREPGQLAALDAIADLLARRPREHAEVRRFQELLRELVPTPGDVDELDEAGAPVLLRERDFEVVLTRFADEIDRIRGIGMVDETDPVVEEGLGDLFDKLWRGAKEAVRQATYWEMKKRAGNAGTKGLGPLIGRLHAADAGLRVHLMGHSFGARLVAFALRGLPDRRPSPVKSVLLVQGAFSQFAFADALPHDRDRAGALGGMTKRVDGPIVVTHSTFDGALARLYPMASFAARDDNEAVDLATRWGAIGHRGAQAVRAAKARLRGVGTKYPFTAGACTNLDGQDVIRRGGGPAGAHSDIFHPEVAWAAVAAAGLA